MAHQLYGYNPSSSSSTSSIRYSSSAAAKYSTSAAMYDDGFHYSTSSSTPNATSYLYEKQIHSSTHNNISIKLKILKHVYTRFRPEEHLLQRLNPLHLLLSSEHRSSTAPLAPPHTSSMELTPPHRT